MLGQYKKFNEPIVKNYARDILLGLEYLHANNIVHRDIKTANILVDKQGRCKLSDFGVSESIKKETESSVKREFKGTVNYTAPECVKDQEYTRFSDVWSVGCTIYELIVGVPPWNEVSNEFAIMNKLSKAEAGPPLPDNISEELKDLLKACFK